MNIPEKLKIHAQTVVIHPIPFNEIDCEGNGGRAIWEQNIIQIGKDMPEDRTAVSLLHEILHMVNTYLDEKECTFISEGLLQVIRDNNIDFRTPAEQKRTDAILNERLRILGILINHGVIKDGDEVFKLINREKQCACERKKDEK